MYWLCTRIFFFSIQMYLNIGLQLRLTWIIRIYLQRNKYVTLPSCLHTRTSTLFDSSFVYLQACMNFALLIFFKLSQFSLKPFILAHVTRVPLPTLLYAESPAYFNFCTRFVCCLFVWLSACLLIRPSTHTFLCICISMYYYCSCYFIWNLLSIVSNCTWRCIKDLENLFDIWCFVYPVLSSVLCLV